MSRFLHILKLLVITAVLILLAPVWIFCVVATMLTKSYCINRNRRFK